MRYYFLAYYSFIFLLSKKEWDGGSDTKFSISIEVHTELLCNRKCCVKYFLRLVTCLRTIILFSAKGS